MIDPKTIIKDICKAAGFEFIYGNAQMANEELTNNDITLTDENIVVFLLPFTLDAVISGSGIDEWTFSTVISVGRKFEADTYSSLNEYEEEKYDRRLKELIGYSSNLIQSIQCNSSMLLTSCRISQQINVYDELLDTVDAQISYVFSNADSGTGYDITYPLSATIDWDNVIGKPDFVTSHGDLSNLNNDDHLQYFISDGSRESLMLRAIVAKIRSLEITGEGASGAKIDVGTQNSVDIIMRNSSRIDFLGDGYISMISNNSNRITAAGQIRSFENVVSDKYVIHKKSGAFAYLTAEATTIISLSDTDYPILGTFNNDLAEEFEAGTEYIPSIKYSGELNREYEIDWHGTFKSDVANQLVFVSIYKNWEYVGGSRMETKCKSADEPYALSGTCVTRLTSGDEIQLMVSSDIANDVTTVHFTTTIKPFFY